MTKTAARRVPVRSVLGLTALAALAALALGSPAATAPASNRVALTSGAVSGAVDDGVLSFKGIPYAAPPVGALRWRPPQTPAAWSGVRPATAYGPDCAQNPFPGDAAPLGVPPAEDCLYVNVWRPAEATPGKLPVMVWIYGGGFVNGGSSPAVYDGSQFAKRGVILVSFNYRLGRFGFFAHPALTKEAGDAEPLGNYGYMDHIAALKWVQQNIARFGGDADNVTVFGESAGGGSALMLLTSPMAKGLFHKVIVESGGGRGGLMPMRRISEDQPGLPSAESVGLAFGKANGAPGADAEALAALRALPADKVVDGLNMASMGSATYVGGPLQDGKVVVGAPDAIIAAGRQAKVPVMIGANSADLGFVPAKDKAGLFAGFKGREAQAAKLYDPTGDAAFRAVSSEVGRDQVMVEPARHVAQLVSAQGLPAYVFRFSYVAESMRKEWAGAPHATEIPFVFDTVRARYGDKLAPMDEVTAKAALAYWVEFAKTGSPGKAGGPLWPRYDVKSDGILDFSPTGPVAQPDPWRDRLDLIAANH